MKEFLKKIDSFIEKTPPHLQDLIKKSFLTLVALIGIIGVFMAIRSGTEDAIPAGMQVAADSRDLFYIRELTEENTRRRKLIEDVETDPLQFPSVRESIQKEKYRQMGKERSGHLMGERDEMLEKDFPINAGGRRDSGSIPFDSLPLDDSAVNPLPEKPSARIKKGSEIESDDRENLIAAPPRKNSIFAPKDTMPEKNTDIQRNLGKKIPENNASKNTKNNEQKEKDSANKEININRNTINPNIKALTKNKNIILAPELDKKIIPQIKKYRKEKTNKSRKKLEYWDDADEKIIKR